MRDLVAVRVLDHHVVADRGTGSSNSIVSLPAGADTSVWVKASAPEGSASNFTVAPPPVVVEAVVLEVVSAAVPMNRRLRRHRR